MLAELERRIRSSWEPLLCGPRPRELRFLGVSGRVEGGTSTLLAFRDGEDRPALAVKVHRDADAGDRVRAEAAMLERLAERADLRGSVPRAVFAERVGPWWVLAQTALDGVPMRTADPARDAALMLPWLERLHRHRPAATTPVRDRARALLDEAAATFDLDERGRALLASVDPDTVAACGAYLAHADLTPHNVLVHQGAIGVIDWTDAHDAGFALEDAFLFLTTAFVMRAPRAAGRAGLDEAFARAWLGDGPVCRSLRAIVRSHASALGIDAGAIAALFALALVAIALSETRRLRAASERGSWPLYALHAAASEGIALARIVEALPWIGFLRALAARGAVPFA